VHQLDSLGDNIRIGVRDPLRGRCLRQDPDNKNVRIGFLENSGVFDNNFTTFVCPDTKLFSYALIEVCADSLGDIKILPFGTSQIISFLTFLLNI